MVGAVKTFALSDAGIEAGTIAIVRYSGTLELATVQHINPAGEWVIHAETYSGPLQEGMTLCKLIVVDENQSYPLKFNQWKKSIAAGEVDSNKKINFEVVPIKFVKGHYMNQCWNCEAQFMAHKRQGICKKCCIENAVARIITGASEVKPATKTKRPRMLAPNHVKGLLKLAYMQGKGGTSLKDFEKWLKKQF